MPGNGSLCSCALSHFSILGTVRTWKFMGTLLFTRGLKQTVCFANYIDDTIVKFWSCIFVLSKVVELGECFLWSPVACIPPQSLPLPHHVGGPRPGWDASRDSSSLRRYGLHHPA